MSFIYIYKAYQGDGDGYFGAEIHQHKTKNNNKISVDRRQWGTADTEMKDPFQSYQIFSLLKPGVGILVVFVFMVNRTSVSSKSVCVMIDISRRYHLLSLIFLYLFN